MQTIAHPYSCFYSIAIAAPLFRDKSFLLPISCCERNVSHLWKKLAYLDWLLVFACLAVFQVFLCLCKGEEQINVFQLFLVIKIDLDVPWTGRKGKGRMKQTRFLWIKEKNEEGGMWRAGERVHEPQPAALGASAATSSGQPRLPWRWRQRPRDEHSSHCPGLQMPDECQRLPKPCARKMPLFSAEGRAKWSCSWVYKVVRSAKL